MPCNRQPVALDGKQSSERPVRLCETFLKSFHDAATSAGTTDRLYRIAGQTIRLRFAGSGLEKLLSPAMEHLAVNDSDSISLTVFLWDCATTGTSPPKAPWSQYYPFTRRGDVVGYNNDRISTAYNFSADALSMMDRESKLAIYWTRDAARLPGYERSSPLRTILGWWSSEQQAQLAHAAAVGTSAGGILITGKGGSGKSTTALCCLGSDLLYLSDDYCMIRWEEEPFAYCLYNSAKLNADGLDFFPNLRPVVSNMEMLSTEKAILFLHQSQPDRIIHRFPIRAIAVAQISGSSSCSVSPASPTEAFKALALSTISQLAGADRTSIERMNRLVHQIPCYNLHLGTDLRGIPPAIQSLLAMHPLPSISEVGGELRA